MRRHLLAPGVLAAVVATAVACSLAFPVPDAKRDSEDASAPGDPAQPGATASPEGDARPLTCAQTDRGPTLVPAGARVCVDATPVTRDEYAAFLGANVPLAGQLVGCESNASWTPIAAGTSGDAPVHGVDWCDAWAFCAWAGKTLCGGFPGDAPRVANGDGGLNRGLSSTVLNDRDASAYAWACEGGDQGLNYPYSNDVDPAQCYQRTFAQPPPEPGPVGSTGCRGGFPGLIDMVGIGEWVDSCVNDRCNVAGTETCRGSASYPAFLEAGFYDYLGRIGFRCCGLEAPSTK